MRFTYILFVSSLLILAACTKKIIVEKPQPEKERPNYSAFPGAFIIKEAVNVRASHSTRAKIIRQLKDGDEVRLINMQNGWYEIADDNGERGWVRSDMVGPRSLSRTRLARAFADSVMPAFKADIYFDKTETYKIIYLTLERSYYKSLNQAEAYARKIALAYQERVYPGEIEVRIMEPDGQELFHRFNLSAIGMADLAVPILTSGRLLSLSEFNYEITVRVAVPDSLTNASVLRQARGISAKYDYPFTKIEVFVVRDIPRAIRAVSSLPVEKIPEGTCRLYYLEDKDGEFYRFNACYGQPGT